MTQCLLRPGGKRKKRGRVEEEEGEDGEGTASLSPTDTHLMSRVPAVFPSLDPSSSPPPPPPLLSSSSLSPTPPRPLPPLPFRQQHVTNRLPVCLSECLYRKLQDGASHVVRLLFLNEGIFKSVIFSLTCFRFFFPCKESSYIRVIYAILDIRYY